MDPAALYHSKAERMTDRSGTTEIRPAGSGTSFNKAPY